MRDHALIEEMIAVRALGGLDGTDVDALRGEMADHGPECAECRRLETEYDEIAGRLAFALDPVEVRRGIEDDVVAAATAERPPSRPGTEREAPRERRGFGRRSLVAVAAALVLFAGGWAVGSLMSRDGQEVLDGARVVAFEGEGGQLSLAYRPGETGVYLLGSGLEPQPEDLVYELWSFRGETPVRGGCFSPAPDGSVFAFLDTEIGATELMAVTLESSSCPSAPTTDPILLAELTV